MLGLPTTKKPVMETKDDIKRRIEEAAKVVDLDQLCLSTQCGFASGVGGETMAIDKSWDVFENPMNRFCRSDQVNYVRKDVPVTYFSLGYAQDYHMATDEPQYIDYDHAARVGRFIHDVMMAVAMRKDKPAISGADPTMPSCNR